MTEINPTEWSFDAIRAVDSARADRLESAGPPDQLIQELVQALSEAITHKSARFAVDSKRNRFIECRAIVQFPVTPELYDWFFNGRTGYRAQFWRAPSEGAQFNAKIVGELVEFLSGALQRSFKARRIDVTVNDGSREERDVGEITIAREDVIATLAPSVSKIWICEHRVSTDGNDPEQIYLSVLGAAEQQPELIVPKWTGALGSTGDVEGDGVRAPFPSSEYSWLDLKGGFLDEIGNVTQIKPEDKRASQIHECGWT